MGRYLTYPRDTAVFHRNIGVKTPCDDVGDFGLF